MKQNHFYITDQEQYRIFVYEWLPDTTPKAAVQIVHGMAEHAGRYREFAEQLNSQGFAVYADDHRGHGKTAKGMVQQGQIGTDGFNGMIEDEHLLSLEIRKKYGSDFPMYLFGHSMGSFISQGFISKYGQLLKGCILSGSAGRQGAILKFGELVAKFLLIRPSGYQKPSHLMDKLSFGSFNSKFKPNRTAFDWLSRDHQKVDEYIKDPYCGAVFPACFFYEFFKGLQMIHRSDVVSGIPKNLPVLIVSGDHDPVGGNGKLVKDLYRLYHDEINLEDTEMKLYKDGRHEILNETNRQEIYRDIINWLKSH